MKSLLSIVSLIGLACATATIPIATTPVDLAAIEDRWSLHVVTLDPDGDERVTRIWIAVIDGKPAIRTNESLWWKNLEREPTIRIRSADVDYSFRTQSVTERSERARIDEAFLAKYGRWERLMFPQARGETHDQYALLVQ